MPCRDPCSWPSAMDAISRGWESVPLLGGEIRLLHGLRSPADSLVLSPLCEGGDRGGGTGTAGYLARRLCRSSGAWHGVSRGLRPTPPAPPSQGGKGRGARTRAGDDGRSVQT